jgi:DNA repair photolyase
MSNGYVYEPAGKAREYCPLALNVYSECDHGCTYCYVPLIQYGRPRTTPKFRVDLNKLRKEIPKIDRTKRILLSFMCDPYCIKDVEVKGTRQVLEVLAEADLKVTILSKGGNRILRDLDLFERFSDITFGTTLVFSNEAQMQEFEPNAAPTLERIRVLRQLHDLGYKTWASIEPVFDPEQSYLLIVGTMDIVDFYKVGKLNHDKAREAAVDWKAFGIRVVEELRRAGKPMYIKKDLRDYLPDGYLRDSECKMEV